ncbi:MAG: FtsX-like permease family protein [Candidatus Dormiibacterota bacterium]
MNQFHLLVRAFRWRASATFALLAVATAAVLAASAGPFFYSAVSSSVLHTTLVGATANSNGITAIPSPELGAIPARAKAIPALASQYRLGRWYRPPIQTLDAGVTIPPNSEGYSFNTDLVSRTNVCAHLTFVSGGCPKTADQVAITKRSSLVLRAQVGSQILVHTHQVPTPFTVTVVGIIKVGTARSSYWMSDNYYDYSGLPTSPTGISNLLHQHAPAVVLQLPSLDAFFTVPATVESLPLTALVQFRLRADSVGINNVHQVVRANKEFAYAANTKYIAPATTLFVSEVNAVVHQDDLMLAIVVVVALELVLLTLFVLFGLVARTVEARQREIALTKLHGFRRRSVLSVGLLEPIVILVVSVPLGVLLAWLAIRLVSVLLLGNAPVLISPLVIYAALAAFGGGLLATVLGARRILRRRLSEELTGAEAPPSEAARAAFEGMALVLAIGAIVELRVSGVLSGGQPNSLALFAPGLIAVAIGVLGVRLVPLACRAVARWTTDSSRLAAHLAVRQVTRRPANLRQILVLVLATGLASFAVVGWAVAASNRVVRADFEIGAARVLRVQVPASVNLVNAVRQADPSGKYAMAAEESETPSEDLLAVDITRLDRVGYWQRSVSNKSLGQLSRWLRPKVSPEMVMTGTQARITVTLPLAVNPEPDLQFNLLDPGSNPTLVDFGVLLPGTHTYLASLPPTCVGGCRVTELVPNWSAVPGGPKSAKYSLTLSQLQTRASAQASWRTAFGGFSRQGYWLPEFGGASATPGPTGRLVAHFTDSQSELLVPGLVPGSLPVTLPGITTVAAQEGNPVYASAEDFDGTELTLNMSRETLALPRIGEYGFLINLPLALRAETGTPVETSFQVWLAPHAPARIVKRLQSDGIKIKSQQTPAPLLYRFDHGGLAYGYLFFLFAAGAAIVLAAGSGVATALMTARGRGFELAVLRSVGVARRTLLLSLFEEQLLVVIPGVALGLLAGLLGAVLALSSVPQFGSNAGAPPPATNLPLAPILVMAGVMLVVLLGTAAITSAVALRRAHYQALRGDAL